MVINYYLYPVNDACRVDVFHSSEYLVDQELDMVIRQLLSLDDVVEVGAHQMGHQVDVIELAQLTSGSENVQKSNDLARINDSFIPIAN